MESSLTGKLLIAMPGIGDPRFEQAVILLCLHNAQQAMGLVLNKPKSELTLSDVLDHLGIEAKGDVGVRAVLDGGPVKPDRGYVLHSDDFEIADGTQSVAPGIRLTVTRDILEALASDHPPSEFVLALGYAGWGEGQLEQELLDNVWLVADCEREIVSAAPFEDKWGKAISHLGISPMQLSGSVGRA